MLTTKDLLTHGIALVPIPFGQKGPTSKCWNEKNNVNYFQSPDHVEAFVKGRITRNEKS